MVPPASGGSGGTSGGTSGTSKSLHPHDSWPSRLVWRFATTAAGVLACLKRGGVSGGETPKLVGPNIRRMYITSWRPSTSENIFLSPNFVEPVVDARLCCARAPAHRHVAPRRPRSGMFTWQRLRRPKISCIGKRGEGRWWVWSLANSRTSFSEGQKGDRTIGSWFR